MAAATISPWTSATWAYADGVPVAGNMAAANRSTVATGASGSLT